MNPYKLQAAQLQATGETLIDEMMLLSVGSKATYNVLVSRVRDRQYIRSLAVFDSKGNPESNSGLRAALNVLRSCLHRKAVDTEDLELLTQALNEPVRLQVSKVRGASKHARLAINAPQLREIVHLISAYTSILTADSRLSAIAPIGTCERCGGIYLKAKCNQKYCSNKCRGKKWSVEKLAVEPHYYAQKAREGRDAKRNMKKGKKRRVT
jgi:hypothetical protein